MKIELLVVLDGPHEIAAKAELREALGLIDLPTAEYATVIVDTPTAAVERRFVGSPSFLVDGARSSTGSLGSAMR